jgi:hypothetical protein
MSHLFIVKVMNQMVSTYLRLEGATEGRAEESNRET